MNSNVNRLLQPARRLAQALALAGALVALVQPAYAAAVRDATGTPPKASPPAVTPSPASTAMPCVSTQTAPLVNVTVGKSSLLKLQTPVARILLGNPEGGLAARPVLLSKDKQSPDAPAAAVAPGGDGVASVDVILLSPSEIYLLGKSVGSTNIVLLSRSGECTLVDIAVGIDTVSLQARLNELLPGSMIKVSSAASSIVLDGTVADSSRVDRALAIAGAYAPRGGGAGAPSIVNMLMVDAPQQVMLEVKVAEVNKTLLDKLGASVNLHFSDGSWVFRLLTNFLSSGAGLLSATKTNNNLVAIDAEKHDALIKILAEPTILAISGQEGSFLAGGKIFIPVSQSSAAIGGFPVITLEEKEFGVALRFTPTVLEGGRINLRVAPEVSELNPEGVGISLQGVSGRSILPSFTTRRAATTVQLFDGQSFVIAGLIKNNARTNIRALPVLGEIPVLGALFRSSDFQTDLTELVFVVTPRLVKPSPPDYALPTDGYQPPNRVEFFLEGKMEGARPQPSRRDAWCSTANGRHPRTRWIRDQMRETMA